MKRKMARGERGGSASPGHLYIVGIDPVRGEISKAIKRILGTSPVLPRSLIQRYGNNVE